MLAIINNYQKLKFFPIFAKNLSTLLAAGFDLQKALEIILADEKDPQTKMVIQQLLLELTAGQNFAASLKVMLPTNTPFKFSQSQILPKLSSFLTELESYYTYKIKAIGKLLNSLVYPLILFLSLLLSLIFFVLILLPNYLNFFSSLNMPLPFFFKLFWHLLTILKHSGLFILFLGLVLFSFFAKSWINKLEKVFYAFFFPASLADVLWLLGIFLENGLDLKSALESLDNFTDQRFEQQFKAFRAKVFAGEGFSQSLNDQFVLTVYQRERLFNAEKTPLFKTILKEIAQDILTEEAKKQQRLIFWLQPILLLFLGLMIAFFLYLTFVPVLSTINSI
jgi:general secretion pathway protein F/type IV pilus assembly protein PilC